VRSVLCFSFLFSSLLFFSFPSTCVSAYISAYAYATVSVYDTCQPASLYARCNNRSLQCATVPCQIQQYANYCLFKWRENIIVYSMCFTECVMHLFFSAYAKSHYYWMPERTVCFRWCKYQQCQYPIDRMDDSALQLR
jgi:hypothetical protein